MIDFQLVNFILLTKSLLSAGYKFQRFNEFISNPENPVIIFRHDVDKAPVKSLRFAQIENELGIKSGETTENLMFSLDSVACLGCCAISPVCVVNGQIHGDLTLKKVKTIYLKPYKK